MKKQIPESPEEYIAFYNAGQEMCVNCGSAGVQADKGAAEGEYDVADSMCRWCPECGATWIQAYELTGYYKLFVPKT